MSSKPAYTEVASAYAEGTRAFFQAGPSDERAGAGPVPVVELIRRAESLESRSAALTGAASAQLEAENTTMRLQASIGLLAKALTDLEVGRTLFAVAEEEAGETQNGQKEIERGAAITRPAELDRTLMLLLGEEPKETERGSEIPTTLAAARAQLADSAEITLMLIRDRAAHTGWEALKGVAKMGAGELISAAGLVSMEIAQAVGQADRLIRLYELARSFLGQALESIRSLLGPALSQTVGEQVLSWLKDAASAKKFSSLMEKLYKTEPTIRAMAKLTRESQAELPRFVAAIQGVDALEAAYRKQIELIDKILSVMKYVAMIPVAAVPQGRLVLATAYILVGGYVVLAGGDYVDWEYLKRIDRVQGVRRILETTLA